MSVKLRWLGYVCFEMVLPSGKVLIVDPFIDYSPTAPIKCQDVTGADYIAVTHGHYDHIPDIGTLVQRFDSTVICSHQVAEPLAKLFDMDMKKIIKVTAGDNITFEDLALTIKRGEHFDVGPGQRAAYEHLTGEKPGTDMSLAEIQRKVIELSSDELFSPKLRKMMEDMRAVGLEGGEQLTFVFQTSDNIRLCICSSAPSEFLRREVVEAHPNVFCMQLGREPEKAAEIAALSGAEVVIPTHHDGGGIEAGHVRAQEFAKHITARSKAYPLDIVHGQWYEISARISPV